MSHEHEPGRGVTYVLPEQPSRILRAVQFDVFFQDYLGSPFAVRTLDGWSWHSSAFHEPSLVATFRSTELLEAVIADASEAALGRMFLAGDLDIQGDVGVLLAVAQYTMRHSEGLSGNLIQAVGRFCLDLHKKFRFGRKHQGPRNWHCTPCPMDLPVEFFEPWLGPLLTHSCASFQGTLEDFQTAQSVALENTCRALNLKPGDRLLDVSCGWGALLLHAVDRWDAETVGLASVDEQAEAAAKRVIQRRLQARISIECRDLRVVPFAPESFHKIADIGIFEQVKFADLADYLGCMQRILEPGGLLLLHRVTRSKPKSGAAIRSLEPDLTFEPLAREIDLMEEAGFQVLKLESLQADYELTLRNWIDRLRRTWEGRTLRSSPNPFERGHRAWLLYLVETATYFRSNDLQVHRVVLRRPSPEQKIA